MLRGWVIVRAFECAPNLYGHEVASVKAKGAGGGG